MPQNDKEKISMLDSVAMGLERFFKHNTFTKIWIIFVVIPVCIYWGIDELKAGGDFLQGAFYGLIFMLFLSLVVRIIIGLIRITTFTDRR